MTKPYTVEAEFTNYPLSTYPTVSTDEEASTISFSFDDPCEGVTLSSANQANPPDANYNS